MARPLVCSVAVAAVCLSLAAPAARALLFEPLRDKDGKRWILVIRDCGSDDGDAGCKSYQMKFSGPGVYQTESGPEKYPGDSAVLAGELARREYHEVWLFSGGGDLHQGVAVGRLLRESGLPVRVPVDAECVSSCTVAFMGGLLRYLDAGASYHVHSSSGVLRLDDREGKLEFYREVLGSLDKLADFATSKRSDARLWAARLLRHFQNTLLAQRGYRKAPDEPGADPSLSHWVRDRRRLYPDDELERFRARYRSEGDAAAQDILMRIERDAMTSAISGLEPMLKALGPRSQPALEMVKVMFKVGIKDSFVLTRDTMYTMGYLTQDVRIENAK